MVLPRCPSHPPWCLPTPPPYSAELYELEMDRAAAAARYQLPLSAAALGQQLSEAVGLGEQEEEGGEGSYAELFDGILPGVAGWDSGGSEALLEEILPGASAQLRALSSPSSSPSPSVDGVGGRAGAGTGTDPFLDLGGSSEEEGGEGAEAEVVGLPEQEEEEEDELLADPLAAILLAHAQAEAHDENGPEVDAELAAVIKADLERSLRRRQRR